SSSLKERRKGLLQPSPAQIVPFRNEAKCGRSGTRGRGGLRPHGRHPTPERWSIQFESAVSRAWSLLCPWVIASLKIAESGSQLKAGPLLLICRSDTPASSPSLTLKSTRQKSIVEYPF